MARSLLVLALAGLVQVACGDDMGRVADGGQACATSNCFDPEPEDYACQDVQDASGLGLQEDWLGELADPIARVILTRPGPCPKTYAELIAKLEVEDRSRCAGGPRASMLGRVISERGQLLGRPEASRVVVSRTCGRREAYEMMFALGPIDARDPTLPEAVEVMAFDDSSDAYNFYSLTGSTWAYHGSSLDFVTRPVADGEGACRGCHTDGGLIMRELSDPWTYWESGGLRTAGAAEILDRFAELGGRGNGPELEQVVRAGNRHWNESRIGKLLDEARVDLHEGSLQALLRPLFCATAINTGSFSGSNAQGEPLPVSELPSAFFLDPLWQPQGAIPVTPDNYRANLTAIGSRIETVLGAKDTARGFTFVERAGADVAYVERMIDARIIDEEFALDVLRVDFTRPVFSTERCALLDFVPTFAELEGAPEIPLPEGEPPPSTDCCIAHASPGCADMAVQDCVCALDDACCTTGWDHACVNQVSQGTGCGSCGAEVVAPITGLAVPGSPATAEPNGASLRRALYWRLEQANPAPGSAAAQLRDNLQREGQAPAHRETAKRFLDACQDRSLVRDQVRFLRDVSDVMSLRRAAALDFTGALDTPGAVAFDDLQPPATTHFDPVTCELVSE